MKTIKESVLLKTSASTDVQCSGGVVTIAGLRSVAKKDISAISQIKYRAEVPQVATVGSTSYTPASNTLYTVWVYDPLRTEQSYNETQKAYSFITPLDVTTLGNAAAQREAIHVAIVAKINADATNHATAATLGGGTGFTVTDDGGYYPVRAQNMTNVRGVNTVKTITNTDGSGFQSTDVTITTSGVYSSGVGAKLAQEAPVIDFVYGNLISGVLDAPVATATNPPTYAVSGQNYDTFVINSLRQVSIINITGQYGYNDVIQYVVVDNGTGNATTNLAGFLAFEYAFRKEMLPAVYGGDSASWIEFFGTPSFFQGASGAVPTTTGENKALGSGQWVYNLIGTNTITTPVPGNTGWLIDLDLTDTEGSEHTPSLLTTNSQNITVGKQEYNLVAKVLVADHTDSTTIIAFRKKEAHAADFNNYNDLAGVGFLGDLVYTWGILNNAATVATNTTVVPTDAAYEEYYINIAISGAVTVKRNSVTYPVYSVGTTALVLDAGDQFIASVRSVNISGGDPDVVLNQLIVTAGPSWLS